MSELKWQVLPQHWVLQLVSWEELPGQAKPPQEGDGLVQDLMKSKLCGKSWWFHLVLVLVPPPQALLQAP